MSEPLTTHEIEVIALVRAGFTRRAIARILKIPEDGYENERETVRGTIQELCARYECRMEQLPAAVERARGRG